MVLCFQMWCIKTEHSPFLVLALGTVGGHGHLRGLGGSVKKCLGSKPSSPL